MTQIEELSNLIKSDPQKIAFLDWAEETGDFSTQRMHDIILSLNDIGLINSVINMIYAEWNFLESQNDPRCYELTDNGQRKLKYPNRYDYLSEPICWGDLFDVKIDSISGVLFLCKQEALRKIIPQKEREEQKAKIIEKYSQPSENKEVERSEELPLPDPVRLEFFNDSLYCTAEGQQQLRKELQTELTNIDTTSGREWFAYYATYRYVRKHLGTKCQYVDFFSDIEKILQGALANIKQDAKGDKRYKHYTAQLSKEVEHWYVDNGKLPPIESLNYNQYHFGCSEKSFNKLQPIIKSLYRKINLLESSLKTKKGVKTS